MATAIVGKTTAYVIVNPPVTVGEPLIQVDEREEPCEKPPLLEVGTVVTTVDGSQIGVMVLVVIDVETDVI